MSRTCWSIWWLQRHRNGSPLAVLFVFVLGRRVRAFIRGRLGLDGPYTPFTRSPQIYISLWHTEAGSDPRGHLWVTWGVYLCAGKPPLADIILSHPPDLT